jgi:hypothetical protein
MLAGAHHTSVSNSNLYSIGHDQHITNVTNNAFVNPSAGEVARICSISMY